jgi:D-alanyl-D-alanine carboxypeptidase
LILTELKAFYEFLLENDVKYKWIGMNGTVSLSGIPENNSGENVAVVIYTNTNIEE